MIKYYFKYVYNTTTISFETVYFDCSINDLTFLQSLSPNFKEILNLLASQNTEKLSDLPQNLNNLDYFLSPENIVSLINILSNVMISPIIIDFNEIMNIIIKSEFPNGINCYSKKQMDYINSLFCNYFNIPHMQRQKLSKRIRSNKQLLQINRGTYKHISQINFSKYKVALDEYISLIYNGLKLQTSLDAVDIFFELQSNKKYLDNDINIYLLNSLIIYFKIDIKYKQTKFGRISYY